MKTTSQTFAERVVARVFGVPAEDVSAAADAFDSTGEATGHEAITFVGVLEIIMQVIPVIIANCPSNSRGAIATARRPNLWVRAKTRFTVSREIRGTGFERYSAAVAKACLSEAMETDEETLAEIHVESIATDNWLI